MGFLTVEEQVEYTEAMRLLCDFRDNNVPDNFLKPEDYFDSGDPEYSGTQLLKQLMD
jgi:hypothetical protein